VTILWNQLLCENYNSPEEMITDFHWKKGMSIEEIAVKLGVSESTLKREIKKLHIKMKKPGGQLGKRRSNHVNDH
jgi:IS30 family transposase